MTSHSRHCRRATNQRSTGCSPPRCPNRSTRRSQSADEAESRARWPTSFRAVPAIDATLEGRGEVDAREASARSVDASRQGHHCGQEARRDAAAAVLPRAGTGVPRRHSSGARPRQRFPSQPLRSGARPKARAGSAARPRPSLGADRRNAETEIQKIPGEPMSFATDAATGLAP